MDKMMFHTVAGRSFSVGTLGLTSLVKGILIGLCSWRLNSWISAHISYNNLGPSGENTFLIFVLSITLMFQVLTSQSDEFILNHMGKVTDIDYTEIEDDD